MDFSQLFQHDKHGHPKIWKNHHPNDNPEDPQRLAEIFSAMFVDPSRRRDPMSRSHVRHTSWLIGACFGTCFGNFESGWLMIIYTAYIYHLTEGNKWLYILVGGLEPTGILNDLPYIGMSWMSWAQLTKSIISLSHIFFQSDRSTTNQIIINHH